MAPTSTFSLLLLITLVLADLSTLAVPDDNSQPYLDPHNAARADVWRHSYGTPLSRIMLLLIPGARYTSAHPGRTLVGSMGRICTMDTGTGAGLRLKPQWIHGWVKKSTMMRRPTLVRRRKASRVYTTRRWCGRRRRIWVALRFRVRMVQHSRCAATTRLETGTENDPIDHRHQRTIIVNCRYSA
jgi:hypothetical protein